MGREDLGGEEEKRAGSQFLALLPTPRPGLHSHSHSKEHRSGKAPRRSQGDQGGTGRSLGQASQGFDLVGLASWTSWELMITKLWKTLNQKI